MRQNIRKNAQRLTWWTPVLICTSIAWLGRIGVADQQVSGAGARGPEYPEYVVYVVSEGADKITRVRFRPSGARIEREITTGIMPAELDGPHGLAIAPDRQSYYVTLGHGQPFGWVLKYSIRDDRVLGQTMLGSFGSGAT